MRLIIFMLCMMTFAPAYAERITVFAAASTTDALSEILTNFTEETGVVAVGSFASSGTLAKQIDNSAPADIFLSANRKWMQWLKAEGKVEPDTIRPLLANNLALVASVKSDVSPASLEKENTAKMLLKGGKIAVGDPAHTPVGEYTKKTLEAYGVWDRLGRNIIRMQTVRVALALVEKNAVPFGIVYTSDAAKSKLVKVIGVFDESTHGPIRYPVAVVAGKKSDNVMKLFHYLQGEKAAVVFEKYGFKSVK